MENRNGTPAQETPPSRRALDDAAIAAQAALQAERGASFRKFVAEKYTGEFGDEAPPTNPFSSKEYANAFDAGARSAMEILHKPECTCSPLRRFFRDLTNCPFFYLGVLVPFTVFGLVVATILFTEWLWRLV